jgi:AmiR/NasT family two-component response regulator
VFRSATIHEEAVKCLQRLIQVLEGVLALALLPKTYAALAAQTAELEAQLAMAKIRDRARGLIRSQLRGASDTLTEFSRTALRRTETAAILERLAVERREEVQERSLTAQAKAVLESVYGMSEEQAHHHLRVVSRKNRRPMKEIALELIGQRS